MEAVNATGPGIAGARKAARAPSPTVLGQGDTEANSTASLKTRKQCQLFGLMLAYSCWTAHPVGSVCIEGGRISWASCTELLYKLIQANIIVWIYMGRREPPLSFPHGSDSSHWSQACPEHAAFYLKTLYSDKMYIKSLKRVQHSAPQCTECHVAERLAAIKNRVLFSHQPIQNIILLMAKF